MVKINAIYNTNNCGRCKVIAKTNRTDMYRVKFLNTGTEKTVRGHQITSGCVRDPYAKTVCGVACVGNIKTKGKYKPFYSVWHDMINRCYNPNNKRAKAYANVTVDERWLVFKNFYEDAPQIEGFNLDAFIAGELVLDKDFKQRQSKYKVYSKNTCVWMDKHSNNLIQDGQQKPFVAISPNGNIYHEFNIADFARRHNLNRKNISAVLHGRGNSVKKWRFSYEEIV